MKSAPEAFAEFRRKSVADQAAAALRDTIRSGVWREHLPGEHELARRLSVSRPTVRAALARLADDGLVAIRKGCRTRICSLRRRALSGIPPSVCLVVPATRDTPNSAYSGHPLLAEMRAQFAVQGIGWEEVLDRNLGGASPDARLANLVQGRHHVCWLLIGATAAIQRWFQQARVPTLVLGSCHEGVALPSVDVAYHAIGWHAAGVLAKHGHQRVVFVAPQPPLAGDLACLRGLSGYTGRGNRPVSVLTVNASPHRANLQASLDRVLAGPQAPTAIMTIHMSHALITLLHLLRTGRRVPQDISLICRETNTTIDTGVPELTRYSSSTIRRAHQAVRLARTLLAGNHVSTEPHLVMPAFIPGATVAATPD